MPSRVNVVDSIESRIVTLRGHKAILDADLALLYGVPTGALTQAVRRNVSRFPDDFAFLLTRQELARLKSQIVISNGRGRGGRRSIPMAFTEEGVAMLSSVLRSPAAIAINIEIMRAFVRLRRAAVVSEQILGLVTELSRRVDDHDTALKAIVETLQQLIQEPPRAKRPICFVPLD